MNESALFEELKHSIIDANYHKRSSDLYFLNFKKIYNDFKNNLSIKESDELLNKIKNVCSSKDIYMFYQLVCEIIIGYYLVNNYKDTFKIEVSFPENKKINKTPPNVDFQINHDGVDYNIEVKCPHLRKKDELHNDSSHLITTFMSRGNSKEEYKETLDSLDDPIIKPILNNSNYKGAKYGNLEDDKIKSFLLSAHSKFPKHKGSGSLNVLFIALDSPTDIFEWYFYFTNLTSGFFTPQSYITHNQFDKVDLVVISNLIAGHRDYGHLDQFPCWNVENYFSYFLVNPFSLRNKELKKSQAYKIYEILKERGVFNQKKKNESIFLMDIFKKVYEGRLMVTGASEKELFSAAFDYASKEPLLYNQILNDMSLPFMNLNENSDKVLQQIDNIIPNNSLDFDSFRDQVVQKYKEQPDYLNTIYDHLFVNYIHEKFRALSGKD